MGGARIARHQIKLRTIRQRCGDSLVLVQRLCCALGTWDVIDAKAPSAPPYVQPLVSLEGCGPVGLLENPVEMEKNAGPRQRLREDRSVVLLDDLLESRASCDGVFMHQGVQQFERVLRGMLRVRALMR